MPRYKRLMKTPATGYSIAVSEVEALKKRFEPMFDQPENFGNFIPCTEGHKNTESLPAASEAEVVGRLTDNIGLEVLILRINDTSRRIDGLTWLLPWSINTKNYAPLFFFHTSGEKKGPKQQFDRSREKYKYEYINHLLECFYNDSNCVIWQPLHPTYRFQITPAVLLQNGEIELHRHILSKRHHPSPCRSRRRPSRPLSERHP